MAYDLDVKGKFVELRAKGMSFSKIAKRLDISRQTLISWSRELQDDLQNAKALHLDGLREKFLIKTEAKLKALRTNLDRMQEELDKRSYKDVPTERLLLMKERVEKQLEAEFETFFSETEFADTSHIFETTRKTWTA